MSNVVKARIVLVLIAAACSVQAAYSQSSAMDWPEITAEVKPWTRWWWMGSAVNRHDLTRNLEVLADAGIGGVEVTSIYGVRGREDAFIPYLSPAWIDMLLHAAGEAERLGMGLDMPPGSGWRTGGPLVAEEYANSSLNVRADTILGGETWTFDGSGRQPDAAVARAADGRAVHLTEQVDGPTLHWKAPDGEWIVYSLAIGRSGEKVKRPAPGGEGLTIDPFSESSVQQFLASYGQEVSRIPVGTIRSFFHDSFEYTGDGSSDLLEAFEERRGYDLRPYVPALAGHGDPDVVARVKSDLRETLSDMLREHFVEQLTAWSHRQGSLSRNQAHGSPGNLLDLYAAADIPETETFGPIGGVDNDPLISKFACSAAHVAGKAFCSAETATWLGEHFTVTLDLLKQEVDQLFLSGVNHVLYHGTTYSPEDADWPGWLFYASTQVNPRNALWRDLPTLNSYIARVQSVLQTGEPDNDVLLYWPVFDNWNDPAGIRMDFRIHNPTWFYSKPVSGIAQQLWEEGYGFDFVSDRQIAGVRVTQEGHIRTPGATYRAVVVPRTDYMPVETLAKLVDLSRAGATILVEERLPADVPGLANLKERRGQMADLKATVAADDSDGDGVVRATVGKGQWLIGDELRVLLERAGVEPEPMTDHGGVQYIRRKHAGGYHYFIRHNGSNELEGWVALAVPAASVVLMDPMTGATGVGRIRTNGTGKPEVYLQLKPGGSLILRTLDEAMAGPEWPYAFPAGQPVAIRGPWHVTFVEGGPELPDPFLADTLASWTLHGDAEAQRFAGTARYVTQFDAPTPADDYVLDLGRVAESARVRINGQDLGVLAARPFQLRMGPLKPTGNVLEVEVTNLSANRIRDMDRRGVPWKIFHDINFVGIDYRPFDAADWPIRPSGLLGPVHVQPLDVREPEGAGERSAGGANVIR